MTRTAIVSGQFYSGNPKELKKQIEELFLSPFGPGSLPSKEKTRDVFGTIVPHAGLSFSGACAAHSYKAIAESKKPDVFVILGTNHTGIGGTSAIFDDWTTPLGTVKCHKKFLQSIFSHSTNVTETKIAHYSEHSIEVQIPFLQYLYGNNVKIVPIVVSYGTPGDELARSIMSAIAETKKRVCVIASSDFTHYGPSYGYVPFDKEIKGNLYDMDRKSIKNITHLDVSGFVKYVKSIGSTICGLMPILSLMEICKIAGIEKGELLEYYTSGDVVKDYTNAVGYGSIIYEKK